MNERTLQGLIKSGDYPRIKLYKARWGEPQPAPVLQIGTENHKAEELASALFHSPVSQYYDEVNHFLDRWNKFHNWHEQCSSIYDTYYLAAVCVFDHTAKRDGYDDIREKCNLYLQNTANLWHEFRDSRGRVVLPGHRTSDVGYDDRRDQCLRLLLGEQLNPRFDWDYHHNMEVNLIRQWAGVEGWKFKPDDNFPNLLDEVIKYEYDGGFVATCLNMTNCYGFPTWVVWSINGKTGSISWVDILGKRKHRQAKSMGWNRDLKLNLDVSGNTLRYEFDGVQGHKKLPVPLERWSSIRVIG